MAPELGSVPSATGRSWEEPGGPVRSCAKGRALQGGAGGRELSSRAAVLAKAACLWGERGSVVVVLAP